MFYLEIIFYCIKILFIPLGIYILCNLNLVAEKSHEYSSKRSLSGMVTTVKWNKGVLIPISIVMIVFGLLNILLLIQHFR